MFQLNETQQMVKDTMRQFCINEVQPHVEAMEDGEMSCFEPARKMYEMMGVGEMIKPALEKLAKKRDEGDQEKVDIFKLSDGGGQDDPSTDPMLQMLILKELSRVSPGLAMSFGVSMGLAGGAINTKGTGRQIRQFGIPVATLDKIGAWCLTEPGAGSDAFGSMKSTAKPDGKDGYIINGTKTFITNGPVADIFVVYARLDKGEPPEERLVHTFILERGMKGLSTSAPFHKMGMMDSPTSEVIMEDVHLEKINLLGESEEKSGRKATKESLGNERSGMPIMCWGIIERCYDECIQYANERVQFGKPLAEFQAIQLKICRMYMHLKNTENIVYRIAWMQKNGINDVSFINASKAYTSTAAVEVANEAVQIFGGYGYMREYPIEKMYRDTKMLELGAGTTDINMMTCARNELGIL